MRSDLFVHLASAGVDPKSDLSFVSPIDLPEAKEQICKVRECSDNRDLLISASSRFVALGLLNYAIDCLERASSLRKLDPDEAIALARTLLRVGDRQAAVTALSSRFSFDEFEDAGALAEVMLGAGRSREALMLLLRQRAKGKLDEVHNCYQLAVALSQCGYRKVAVKICQSMLVVDESFRPARTLLASQLAAVGLAEQAAENLDVLRDLTPAELELRASIALAMRDLDRALATINQAIAAEPGNAFYLRLRAQLHFEQGNIVDAVNDVSTAVSILPDDESVLRLGFAIFTEASEHDDAVRVGGRLVARNPEDARLSDTLKIVLERKAKKDVLTRVRHNHQVRDAPPDTVRLSRSSTTPDRPIGEMIRVVNALIIRETKTRFGRSRYGYFWVLFEPLAHIGLMITLVSLAGLGHAPPVGPNFALFYFTGIIPFHLFTHTISHMMNSVPENRPLLQLPLVKTFDVFLARGVLELVTEVVVAFILILGFSVAGIMILPIEYSGIVIALLLVWMTAFGLGLLFSVFNSYFKGWERVWSAVTSLLYFGSGIFYIPRAMPEWIREILAWNPILQAIELIRSSYFFVPHPFWLSLPYIVGFALVSLASGLLAIRVFHRKLVEHE